MAIARVEEIRATSTVSFEDAIRQGVARAHRTLHHVRSGWAKERQLRVEGDEIAESQVDLVITLKRKFLAIAQVEEISATSTVSFEDAIRQGLARAGNTLHQVRGGWVKERQVRVEADKIVEYQVNLLITFMLDD